MKNLITAIAVGATLAIAGYFLFIFLYSFEFNTPVCHQDTSGICVDR
jgi:hypothetical protein